MTTEKWVSYKLKDVGRIVSGGTPSTANDEYWSEEIAWITPADLSGYANKHIGKGRKSISKKGLDSSSAKILPKGSVLFSSRAPIGYVAIAANELATNQGFKNIIPNASVSSDYLYYYLKSSKKLAEESASGTTFKEISASKFAELPIPVPPLKIQQQIVSKIEELFSELDKGTENLKILQQQLKVYRQAVLKRAFDNTYSEEGCIADVIEKIQIGPFGAQLHKEDYIEGGIPLINPTHIRNGQICPDYSFTISVGKRDSLSNYILEEGDIIMGRRGEMARCGLVSAKETGWFCGTGSLYFRPSPNKANPRFLYYYLSSDSVKKYLEANAGGTTMANLNKRIVGEIPAKLPPLKEQLRIVQEIESRLSVCEKIEEIVANALQEAEGLRQSILKSAFEGKLVKQREHKAYKPKNEYFYQAQILGFITEYSKQKGIKHGEMTIAKYAFMLDRLYDVETYYDYKRWHLGPYPPEMKKVIKNKKYFVQNTSSLELADAETLLKYNNPFKKRVNEAIDDLASIFSKYSAKERSDKTELLATVCKVIEDIQSTDLDKVRQSMKEWPIELPTTKFKNKAEKFSKEDTEGCIKFIIKRGWDKKLIKENS